MPQAGCNLDYPFYKQVIDSGPDVVGASQVHVHVGAVNEANKLYVFTGIANIDFRPFDPETLRFGLLEVVLDFDLSAPRRLVDAAAYAALASFTNVDSAYRTTFAVDCVELVVANILEVGKDVLRSLPVLKIYLAVTGNVDNDRYTSIQSIAYQANIQVNESLFLMVSAADSKRSVDFEERASIEAGSPWLGRVLCGFPAPSPGGYDVSLQSMDPIVSVPAMVNIPAGAVESVVFTGPPTLPIAAPPHYVDVIIAATINNGAGKSAIMNGATSNATIRVIARP